MNTGELRTGQNARAWQAAIADMGGPVMQTCPECCGIGWVRTVAKFGHEDFGKLVRCHSCAREMGRMRPAVAGQGRH